MIPDSLAAAKAAGAPKFNTGRPCRNGHLADRYTQSGSCQQCIAESNKSASAKPSSTTEGNDARKISRAQLTEVRFRCYPQHLEQMRATAIAMTKGKAPELTDRDIYPGKPPVEGQGGTANYRFNIFLEHRDFLLGVMRQLWNQVPVDIAAERRKAMGKLDGAYGPGLVAPVPEFKP